MATLSSSSTDQQVWDEYDNTAGWEEDSSSSLAKRFITACRILLRRRPTNYTSDGQTVAFDDKAIRDDMDRARKFLDANDSSSGGSVRYLDTSGIRD